MLTDAEVFSILSAFSNVYNNGHEFTDDCKSAMRKLMEGNEELQHRYRWLWNIAHGREPFPMPECS